MPKKIILLEPRGFCAGVCRAIQCVEDALLTCDEPLFILHQLVHNDFIIDSLKKRGVCFVESPKDVPENGRMVLSAHGVPLSIEMLCKERHLQVIDATCPLVKKVHHQLQKYVEQGVHVILIGHPKHREVVGTLGRVDAKVTLVQNSDEVNQIPTLEGRIAYITQTTLSDEEIAPIVDALRKRFPQIEGDGNVCYATTQRQDAVRALGSTPTDLLIVVGSSQSSNSQRLREVGELTLGRSILISDANELTYEDVKDANTIAITSGASTPECLVQDVVAQLQQWDDSL